MDLQCVRARLGSTVTQGGRQKGDMGCLVSGDLSEAVADPAGEAGVLKVGLGVVGETLLVEGVLEVLKGQSEVENLGVCKGWV